MALVALDGTPLVPIGPGFVVTHSALSASSATMDAANEAIIYVGHVITSDGGSHTIDTTGSSSLEWRTAAVTFANAGTTVKVGLAPVLATAGPPARATHASDVISFDVSKSLTGGGGGITANAWQVHVPDTGSKTVANGDFIAFAVQMTARGGADSVLATFGASGQTQQRPVVNQFNGGSYTATAAVPNAIIKFSDGAFGYFQASDVFSTLNSRVWNSGSATKEYGQLFKLPFPAKVYGLYGWVDPDADFDCVLYSDPLGGSPVAEKTVSVDANTVATANSRRFAVSFASPYTTTADQLIAAVFKPGASNISASYKTLGHADHRLADPWGVDGYGVARASGAFAAENSNLDHYYIGLIVGAFDAGGSGSGIGVLTGGGLAR